MFQDGLLNISFPWQIQAQEETSIITAGGKVQKSPSSKAAAILTRGAYVEYVSTAKWRERRWRLFSTFPGCSGLVLHLVGKIHALMQYSQHENMKPIDLIDKDMFPHIETTMVFR